MANSYTLAGTARSRGLGQVNPRLVEILAAAAARSPYQVQIFSGKREGSAGGSRHNTGNAIDIALIDPSTGQAIPNYKSSTGFPIYAEFARIAREEQMRLAPELASQFRWGGGFSDKDFDLMHFDFKPGGGMAYWTWEDGGKLTPAGAAAVPKFGAGWVYANGERRRAPEGQYASLWGREPLQAPQDAQTAIASLVAPQGGTQVPDAPTPMMGYAPNLPGGMPPASAMPQVASAAPMPIPEPPPSWAQGGFGQDTMVGGTTPPLPQMRNQGTLDQQRADQLDEMLFGAGPHRGDFSRGRPEGRWTGGGAPDASQVPNPVSRLANGVTPPPPLSAAMPNPPMRPGGAPDAGLVPNPPPRASGLPDPRMRPDINDPSLSFNAPPYAGGGPTSGPPLMPAPPPMVAGRPGFPGGGMPAASRQGDLSAAMGNAPPDPFAGQNERMDAFQGAQDSRFLAREMGRNRAMMEDLTNPPWAPTVAGRLEFPGALPGAPKDFSAADPALSLPPSWSPATSFPAPPPPIGTVAAGSTGGENFTPAPPMPSPPPDPLASRFNDAFSPGGPGQIMDLQTAFNRRNAPPTMSAQSGINSVFGAPPAPAAPSNLAIPFTEVPGYQNLPYTPPPNLDPSKMESRGPYVPTPGFSPGYQMLGSSPAAAATVASPLPMPTISRSDFSARFGDLMPGQAGVSAPMPQPMDTRSQAQRTGSTSAPPPLPPPPTLRQTNTAPQKKGLSTLAKAGIGGLVGGPLGAAIGLVGGGLFGGGGGGLLSGFGTPASFAWSGGGTAPYGNGGSTNYQKGTSNALGGSNSLTWTGSNGQPVTVVQDPWTGTYMSSW